MQTSQRRHGVFSLQRREEEKTSPLHTQGLMFSTLFDNPTCQLFPIIPSYVFFSNRPFSTLQNEPLTTRLRSLRPNKTKRQRHAYQTRSAQVHRSGTRSRNSRNRRNSEGRLDSDSDGEVWSAIKRTCRHKCKTRAPSKSPPPEIKLFYPLPWTL